MLFDNLLEKIGRFRLAMLGVAVLLVPVAECAAQAEWQRTVKVIAPIEEGIVTRALTDSVVAMAQAQDLPLRRAPQSDTTAPLEKIEAELSKDGLATSSANRVFVTYRFTFKRGSLQRDILNLHFIYRPTAEQGEDIPILYVDLTERDLYQRLLVEKGVPSPINEMAFHPFEEETAFHSIQDTATVVQVGNRIIRDPKQAAAEKQKIMETVQRLTYN